MTRAINVLLQKDISTFFFKFYSFNNYFQLLINSKCMHWTEVSDVLCDNFFFPRMISETIKNMQNSDFSPRSCALLNGFDNIR